MYEGSFKMKMIVKYLLAWRKKDWLLKLIFSRNLGEIHSEKFFLLIAETQKMDQIH